MSFFSIIIPTYNRANLISETIISVQNQIFNDWECIIVDDGSTDNTKEVITEIAKKDPRIKYIYQNNAERSAARNNGIRNSVGQYICFLDSDDAYTKNHLSILHKNILQQESPIALFFVDQIIQCEKKTIIVDFSLLNENALKYFFENAVIPTRVCIHSKILETEKFDEDIVIVEDMILWVRIAFQFKIIQLLDKTIIYTLHADNSVNIKNFPGIKRYDGLMLFRKKYSKVWSKLPLKSRQTILSDTLLSISKSYILCKKNKLAIKTLIKSILLYPFSRQTKHKIYLIICLLYGKPTQYD